MIVGDLNRRGTGATLGGRRPGGPFGPFNVRIRSNLGSFASLAHQLYAPYPLPGAEAIADFHVQISSPRGLRRWCAARHHLVSMGKSPLHPMRRSTLSQRWSGASLGVWRRVRIICSCCTPRVLSEMVGPCCFPPRPVTANRPSVRVDPFRMAASLGRIRAGTTQRTACCFPCRA